MFARGLQFVNTVHLIGHLIGHLISHPVGWSERLLGKLKGGSEMKRVFTNN